MTAEEKCDMVPSMKACEKPTKMFPNGRTGTEAGEAIHRYHKEEVCDECREARNKRYRERRYERSPWMQPHEVTMECERRTKKFPNGKTGLHAGFAAHQRIGEKPCRPCYEANREYSAARMRGKQEQYREKQLIRNRRRRARKLDLPEEKYSVEDIARKYGTTCYLCETEVDLSITDRNHPGFRNLDHLVPLHHESCPGDIEENVRITHGLCNRKKNGSLIEDLALPFDPPGEGERE